MIMRLVAGAFLVWIFGFLGFAFALPGPVEEARTDAVVVPTGSDGRIARGLEVLRRGEAGQMLVSGVDPEVKPREFEAEYKVERRLMRCCITLEFAAVDTRGNARETAAWVKKRGFRSIRLVTADWHMRRAAAELDQVLPADVVVVRDAVPSRPSLRILFLEYNKLLASGLSRLTGASGGTA